MDNNIQNISPARILLLVILFLFTLSSYGCAENRVEITVIKESGTKKIEIEANSTELMFIKEFGIVDIIGLDQLPKLNKITFDMCRFNEGLGLLSKCPQIEILVINFCQGVDNLKILTDLHDLEQLVLRALDLTSIDIDLKMNAKLEYFELDNCRIKSFSRIKSIPQSLKYMNLYFNKVDPQEYITIVEKTEHIYALAINSLSTISIQGEYNHVHIGVNPWKVIPIEHYHSSS